MLKMNELIKQTSTPKSTILYYVKEGLLSEPDKPKPNMHLYSKDVIEQINFIHYLQKNFHASIAQIKAVFAHKKFNPKNPYASLLDLIDLVMGADLEQKHSQKELCKTFGLTQKSLQKIVDGGLIHPRKGVFTKTEKTMLAIISKASKEELDLIKSYAKIAKEMSILEASLAKRLIKNSKDSISLKSFFDLLLILKPYIFNMQTLSTYKDKK